MRCAHLETRSVTVPTSLKKVVVDVPLKLASELNMHEQWRARHKRANAQRELIGLTCMSRLAPFRKTATPLVVTIERIAPSALDDDNLVGAGKHVRDAIAEVLGLPNDRDARVTWLYGQRRRRVREYATVVTIEENVAVAASVVE